jgi:hypothetical protein
MSEAGEHAMQGSGVADKAGSEHIVDAESPTVEQPCMCADQGQSLLTHAPAFTYFNHCFCGN